jgi:type VI secretion system secreted protein Hcp
VAFDIFLKFDDATLAGESRSDKHKDEIEVLSFSWGASRDAGRTDPQELAFVTPVSVASPTIAKFCAEGTPIGAAQISVNSPSAKGDAELLMIKLANIVVGSYQLGGALTDPQVADRFTLAFTSMTISKRRQNADGSVGTAVSQTIEFPPPAT